MGQNDPGRMTDFVKMNIVLIIMQTVISVSFVENPKPSKEKLLYDKKKNVVHENEKKINLYIENPSLAVLRVLWCLFSTSACFQLLQVFVVAVLLLKMLLLLRLLVLLLWL